MSDSNRPFPGPASPATLKAPDTIPAGQRKLVRPSLSARALAPYHNSFSHYGSTVMTARANRAATSPEDSHAEAFYFQKQMQEQTRMVVVLEDGEHLEGILEWYDRHAVKLRNGNRLRALIYKSSIKYLYKAVEAPPHTIMH